MGIAQWGSAEDFIKWFFGGSKIKKIGGGITSKICGMLQF